MGFRFWLCLGRFGSRCPLSFFLGGFLCPLFSFLFRGRFSPCFSFSCSPWFSRFFAVFALLVSLFPLLLCVIVVLVAFLSGFWFLPCSCCLFRLCLVLFFASFLGSFLPESFSFLFFSLEVFPCFCLSLLSLVLSVLCFGLPFSFLSRLVVFLFFELCLVCVLLFALCLGSSRFGFPFFSRLSTFREFSFWGFAPFFNLSNKCIKCYFTSNIL